MSLFWFLRLARKSMHRFVPAIALLLFLSPLVVAPTESSANPPYRLYLPLALSNAEATVRWSTPAQVDGSDRQAAAQWNPAVALDSNGNAYAVWLEGYYPDNRNYFSFRPAGAGAVWSIPQPLRDAGLPQSGAVLTTDPHGNLYVTWSEEGKTLLLTRSPTGIWSEPEVVQLPKGSAGLRMAADAQGRLHLLYKVYQGDYDDPIDLFYSLRDASGVWYAPEQVNDRPGSLTWKSGPSGTPSLAVDGAGNAHAAWREVDNWYNWQIFTSDRRPDGSWSPNEVVEAASGDNAPSLAAGEKGNLYLAFAKNGAGFAQVRFAYRAAGGQWQPSVQINTRGPRLPLWGESGGPSLQIDRSGAIYVIWPAQEMDGDTRIYFDWRVPVTDDAVDPEVWHADESIAKFSVVESQELATDPRGNLVAVWTQHDYTTESPLAPRIYFAARP